jgi:predicted lipoprotein with Yx(FWY)xxD motif
MRSKSLAALAVGAVAVLGAAGCGSSSDNSSSSSASATNSTKSASGAAATPAVVVSTATVNNSDIGKKPVLVDSKGRTLYLFEKDKGGKSSCSGACAQVWPPLTGTATAAKGASSSKLSTTKRSDGTTQVVYGVWPLYYYVGDKKPGDANGNDLTQFGAQWYAVTPAGAKASG